MKTEKKNSSNTDHSYTSTSTLIETKMKNNVGSETNSPKENRNHCRLRSKRNCLKMLTSYAIVLHMLLVQANAVVLKSLRKRKLSWLDTSIDRPIRLSLLLLDLSHFGLCGNTHLAYNSCLICLPHRRILIGKVNWYCAQHENLFKRSSDNASKTSWIICSCSLSFYLSLLNQMLYSFLLIITVYISMEKPFCLKSSG